MHAVYRQIDYYNSNQSPTESIQFTLIHTKPVIAHYNRLLVRPQIISHPEYFSHLIVQRNSHQIYLYV